MARLLPSDISELSLSLGETAELRTLQALQRGLPSAYTVFHSVHWSRDVAYHIAFGEADFIIVNQSGDVVVVEQKSGALDETADGLIKRYSDGQKNVATQIHRTLDGIRDQFKRQTGHNIVLDYLIYCPDHRLRDLNAVGLNASRIVDARDASHLTDRITSILAPGSPTDHGKRVLRFLENKFYLVPDIHAHITAGERAMIRLSGGLAETHMLITIARDAGSVLMHTHDRRIDHLHRRIMSFGQCIHNLVPDASPSPAHEAIVTGRIGAKGLWQIAPWRA